MCSRRCWMRYLRSPHKRKPPDVSHANSTCSTISCSERDMQQNNLLLLREDIPESKPGFDFDLLADSLVGVIEQERTHAFVLGLHGPWGAGKTTLLNALRDRLAAQAPFSPTVIEFNAWKYQDREALWRALIIRVLAALRDA